MMLLSFCLAAMAAVVPANKLARDPPSGRCYASAGGGSGSLVFRARLAWRRWRPRCGFCFSGSAVAMALTPVLSWSQGVLYRSLAGGRRLWRRRWRSSDPRWMGSWVAEAGRRCWAPSSSATTGGFGAGSADEPQRQGLAVRGECFLRSTKQRSCEEASSVLSAADSRLLLLRSSRQRRRRVQAVSDGCVRHRDFQGSRCIFLVSGVLCVKCPDSWASGVFWVLRVCCTGL